MCPPIVVAAIITAAGAVAAGGIATAGAGATNKRNREAQKLANDVGYKTWSQEFEYTKQRDADAAAFNKDSFNQNLAWQKDSFGQQLNQARSEFDATSNANRRKEVVANLNNMLVNNTALNDRLLKIWGGNK